MVAKLISGTYRTLASVCLRFRRNLWYFCRSPMLPCSACILAATAAVEAAAVSAAAAATAAAVAAAADAAAAEGAGAWLMSLLLSMVDDGAVPAAAVRSWILVPPFPDTSELTAFVTLFVRKFFLRFRSAAVTEDGWTDCDCCWCWWCANTTTVVAVALGQVVIVVDGMPDDEVGEAQPVVSRTVSEWSSSSSSSMSCNGCCCCFAPDVLACGGCCCCCWFGSPPTSWTAYGTVDDFRSVSEVKGHDGDDGGTWHPVEDDRVTAAISTRAGDDVQVNNDGDVTTNTAVVSVLCWLSVCCCCRCCCCCCRCCWSSPASDAAAAAASSSTAAMAVWRLWRRRRRRQLRQQQHHQLHLLDAPPTPPAARPRSPLVPVQPASGRPFRRFGHYNTGRDESF